MRPHNTTLEQVFRPPNCEGRLSRQPLSLLELFLPDGAARRSAIIGSNCPPILSPPGCSETTENAELIVLAPTLAECRTRGWLEDAVQSLSGRLGADGLAYVLAPALWRFKIRNLLGDRGLSIEQAILHVPDQRLSRFLIPLDARPAQYAASKLLSLSLGKHLLAVFGVCLLRFDRLFKCLLPSAGLLVRRPGSRPIFEWLFRLCSATNGNVVIATSSRGKDGSIVLHAFPGRTERATVVAKLTMKSTESLIAEAATLRRLEPIASAAGAQIPRVLSLEHVNGHPVLLQTGLCGQSVAALLASRANRLVGILERLVSWLESWNRSTLTAMPLDIALGEREIVASAGLVTAQLDAGSEYQNWLRTRCHTVMDRTIPLVTTHNDLTMWNLLLTKQRQLGVVDWEAAREKDLPLVDFFYAIADAVTIAHGFADRSRALEACFVVGGAYERGTRQLLMRLRRVVRMSDDMVEVCFHACWLRHAANECKTAGSSDPRPFLKIVEWLTVNRTHVSNWVRG